MTPYRLDEKGQEMLGAGCRKDFAAECCFRDSRAASVTALVSDALRDFIGKAVCGMPLFE